MSKESDELKSSKTGWIIISVLVLLIGLTFMWGHSLQKKRDAARQEAEQRTVAAEQARELRKRETVERLANMERMAQEKRDYERKRDEHRDRAEEMKRIKEETAEKTRALEERTKVQLRIIDTEARIQARQKQIEEIERRTEAIRNGK
jgi:ABC-type protease/lipase transport system fused ATPase/permease subunit